MSSNSKVNNSGNQLNNSQLPSANRRNLLVAATVIPGGLLFGSSAMAASKDKESQSGKGKTAVVTGSSRGIGAATVKRLAQEGYNVTVNYLNSSSKAERVVHEIKAAGGNAIAVRADVSDPAQVKRLFDSTERAFGRVDVVVSNAGVMFLAPFKDMSDADFDRMMAVNLKGSFNVLREAANRVRDGGRIFALSSSITQLRSPTYGPYTASKGAQDFYVNVLAKELAGRQISVNAIAPGVVNTTLFTDGKTPQDIQGFVQRTPHRRLGEPEDIANVVAALCSADCAWISGQTVFANGGIV